MPTYTTKEDFASYVEGWVTDDKDALDRLLDRAERDVDGIVGHWSLEDNGLKFGEPAKGNEKGLSDSQVAALSRAVCAQAEYRLSMGEDFMVRAQVPTSGPDFSTSQPLPYIGPKVWAELEGTGLLRLTSTVGMGSDRPPWWSFSHNVD